MRAIKLLTAEIDLDGTYLNFDRRLFRNIKWNVGFVVKNTMTLFFPAQYSVQECLSRLTKLPEFNDLDIDTSVTYVTYAKMLHKRRYGTEARMRRETRNSYNDKLEPSVKIKLTERLNHAKVLRFMNNDRRKKTRKRTSGSFSEFD